MLRPGRRAVLVVAPHGIAHRRNGVEKAQEFYTGGLSELCADELDWGCLVPLREYDDREGLSPVARVGAAMVDQGRTRIMVELHGMAPRPEVDVCIGTCGLARSIAPAEGLVAALSPTFGCTIDDPFTGATSLGAQLAETRPSLIPLHVELGARLRSDTTTEDDLASFIDGLSSLIDTGGPR